MLQALAEGMAMPNDLTANLLRAWREAERAAEAARRLAGHAQEAAEAASAASEAARQAALDAGVSLERADLAVGRARGAYHEREADVTAHQVEEGQSTPSILDLSR